MISHFSQVTRFIILTLAFLHVDSLAEIKVNGDLPITNQIIVNRIRTFNSSGQGATVFGSASEEADIIDKINEIWAQSGIEIIFEDIENFTSDFAYDDNGGAVDGDGNPLRRPRGDLGQILNLSGTSASDSNTDIDMFFVNLCPGFAPLSLNSAAGLANVDRPGTTVYVGSNLINFDNGRSVIASVVAHEIGHNLGLTHTPDNTSNLMSPGGNSEQITPDQTNIVFTNNSNIDGFDLLQSVDITTNYELFVEQFDLQEGLNGDDDNDGLTNFFEYAIGANPVDNFNAFPTIEQLAVDRFSISIPKNSNAVEDGVTYTILVSSDLNTFNTAGFPGSGTTLTQDDATGIAAQFDSSPQGFFQLKLENPPAMAERMLTPQLAAILKDNDLPAHAQGTPEAHCGCDQSH